MKPHRMATFAFSMLISITFTVAAIAGVEPSPFKPEINKLHAVTNNLTAINNRIEKVLASPPDDQMPSPNVRGAVRRLNAINSKLLRLDARVESVMDEVLSCPPDDQCPVADVLPALEAVESAVQTIVNTIDAYLGCPPDDTMPFCSALNMVGGTAIMMVKNVQAYIRQINGTGDETGLTLLYSDPNVLTEIHCYGLDGWSPAGEIHGGIDLKPPYVDLNGTLDWGKVEVVAPASGVVDFFDTGLSGKEAKTWVVILKMNAYWYAILVFEPQSKDDEIIEAQEISLNVTEGQQVTKGERIGDLIVGRVIEDAYPHIHLSLLYKNPGDTIEELINNSDPIVRSNGTDLAPVTGPGSPWDPQDLEIPTTFFCPYEYSVLEAQQAMNSVPKYNVNGELCDCVCAYNSVGGNCGDVCNPLP